MTGVRIYRILWSVSAWCTALLGWVFAAIGIPVEALVAIAIMAGVVAIFSLSLRKNGFGDPETARSDARGIGRAVLAAVGVGVATAGLTASAGGAGLALVLMVAGASPAVVGRLTTRMHADERPAPSMTDDELCRAWRASYTAMHQVCSAAELARLVELRSEYLDEFERRDGAGFGRWMSGLPRSDGDPPELLDPARRPPETSAGQDPR